MRIKGRLALGAGAVALVCAGQAGAALITQTFTSDSFGIASVAFFDSNLGQLGAVGLNISYGQSFVYNTVLSSPSATVTLLVAPQAGILGYTTAPSPALLTRTFTQSDLFAGFLSLNSSGSFADVLTSPSDIAAFSRSGPRTGSALAYDFRAVGQDPTVTSGIARLMLDSRLSRGNVSGTISYFFMPYATYLPEPQSWAMMIVGFGAIGASLRRRRTAVSFA